MTEYKTNIPEITLKYKTGDIKKVKISSASDGADYLKLMYDQDTIEISESAIVVYFNQALNSIGWFRVSQGGMTGTVIDVRLVLATALKCGAAGIMMSHNHPSGNTEPSESDKNLTQKLKEAGKIMDIRLIDHIILTANGSYFSFADEGLL